MRVLHTSDWHLGKVLHERSLLDDQRVVLERLLALLAADPHDLLVIAGDVFDRSVPPEDAVEVLGRFLGALREACPDLPVVVIAGNHDSATRLAWGAGIFARAGIHLRGDVARIEEPVRIGGAEIWAIPFLWPGSVRIDGTDCRSLRSLEGAPPLQPRASPGAPCLRPADASVVTDPTNEPMDSGHLPTRTRASVLAGDRYRIDDLAVKTQAGALEEAVRRVRARATPGAAQVLVAHCFASGGAISDSERALVGTATQVGAELFAGFDYVALGHLHQPQRVADNAWYSGSPLKYSFSEHDHEKCFLSVVVAPGAAPAVTRLPIAPPREMSILKGSFADLLGSPDFAGYREHYLRIELDSADVGAQPAAALRQRFPHLLDFRMPMPAGGGARAAARSRDAADIETDFLDFERHLLGEAPVPEPLLASFRALRASVEQEA